MATLGYICWQCMTPNAIMACISIRNHHWDRFKRSMSTRVQMSINSTFGRELPLLLSVCWKNLRGASSAALQPPHDPSNVSGTPVKVCVFLFLQQVELSSCPSLGAATNARESQCQSDAFQVLSSPADVVDTYIQVQYARSVETNV